MWQKYFDEADEVKLKGKGMGKLKYSISVPKIGQNWVGRNIKYRFGQFGWILMPSGNHGYDDVKNGGIFLKGYSGNSSIYWIFVVCVPFWKGEILKFAIWDIPGNTYWQFFL
jgi:hypothetical protein